MTHQHTATILLSKKAVAIATGCWVVSSGRVNGRALRCKVFTDTVLAQLGITEVEYRHLRIFTAEQSVKLRTIIPGL